MRSDPEDKEVSRLSRGKKRIAGNAWSAGQKDWVVGRCGSGFDSKSGEREGELSDRPSWTVLGEFGFGPKDTDQKDSGGKEIGSGDLLVAPPFGRAS